MPWFERGKKKKERKKEETEKSSSSCAQFTFIPRQLHSASAVTTIGFDQHSLGWEREKNKRETNKNKKKQDKKKQEPGRKITSEEHFRQ